MRRSGGVLISVVAIVAALLWARSGEFVQPSHRQDLSPSPPTSIQELGVTRREIFRESQREFRIEGVVLDARQHIPIAKAELEFESEGGDRVLLSGADGRFSLALEGATWLLARVRAKGYGVATPELVFSQAKSDVSIELVRLRERRGRVLSHTGQPIEGALIVPWATVDFGGRELESTFSDQNGEFRLYADPVLNLEISHQCCVTADAEVGPTDDEFEIRLEPARIKRVVFRGIVVDEDGRHAEGARVSGIASVAEPDVAQSIELVAGVGGRFEVEVPAGARVDLTAELGENLSQSTTFNAADEGRLVVLDHAGSFSGRVTNEEGEPVTRFTIAVRGPGAWQERQFTAADGAYTFTGLPRLGFTVVTVNARDYLSGTPQAFELARKEQRTQVDFVLRRGQRMFGVVFDEQTLAPLAAANVSLTENFGRLNSDNGRARTDGLGRFTLTGLKPGRAEVVVSRSGYRSRQSVIDTASQAEVRIGLNSTNNPIAESEYAGVGMQFANVEVDAGAGYFVKSLHPQGGALVAGIFVGDEILAVNGIPAGTIETADFLLHIKGEEGSLVTLTVRREGKTFDVHAVRRRLSATW